jgi:hypothetical protein
MDLSNLSHSKGQERVWESYFNFEVLELSGKCEVLFNYVQISKHKCSKRTIFGCLSHAQNSEKKLHKRQTIKMGTGALLPGVKIPEHEAGHSIPSSKVMNAWSCTSVLSCTFMTYCSTKRMDNFIAVISGFCHAVNEILILLGCYAAYTGG